jgi:thiamine-phosphate pyrophosphorylase
VKGGGICYVTDRRATGGRPLLQVIEAAIAGGIDLLQVREKDLPAAELLDLVRAAQDVVKRLHSRCRIVVNDRLDVALAARVHGVHLPAEGLPIREVRARLAGRCRIGRSVHSAAEATEAAAAGADYIFFGPVFETPGKAAFGPPQGIEALRKIVRSARLPIWAIGGIDRETAAGLRETPIAGIAAIRAIGAADDPAAAVRSLRVLLGGPAS